MHSTLLSSTICGIIILIGFFIWKVLRKSCRTTTTTTGTTTNYQYSKMRKRSWSFSSEGLFIGPMAPEVKCPSAIINCAMFFEEECPSKNEVTDSIVKPMLEYERLSTVPLPNGMYQQRQNNNMFAPECMVRTITIHGSQKVTMDNLTAHLDDDLRSSSRNLPWWEFLLVKNEGTGNSAVLLRIEHCLADGLSISSILENLITDEDGNPYNTKTTTYSKMLQKTSNRNLNPLSYIKELFHILLLEFSPYDSPTIFTKPNQTTVYSGMREVLLLPEISLDLCKKLKNTAHCTVNDILLFAISEAIIDYCKDQNCPIIGSDSICRALVPFGYPRSPSQRRDKKTALGNTWSMLSLPMFFNESNLLQRLQKIHETTTKVKSSPRGVVQLFLQNTLGPLLPVSKSQQMVRNILTRHSLVVTNLIGPDKPCKFAGKTIVGVQLLNLNFITQASFLSYNGRVFGSIVLDTDQIKNSQKIATFYGRAFSKLSREIFHDKRHDT